MIDDARTRAETLEWEAGEKAASLERNAARQHTEILGAIIHEKSILEKQIDELRAFECEYHTRLKTYLQSQLRQLDGHGSAAPTDLLRTQEDFVTSPIRSVLLTNHS